jgi:hypothetical protein
MASCVNFGAQQYFGFDPRTIPGCALWLDAADSSTLTLSGSSVTAWNDKSGNGRHATGVVAPTYDGTTRYILFNGSSQYFTLPNDTLPTGNTPYSMFFVAYTNNSANPQWIIAGGTESTNQAIGAIFYTTNAVWHSWWGNEYRVDNSISNGVPAILNLSYSTTRTTIINGGTATTNTPGASRGSSSGPNFIGRRVSSVEYLNGGIGEIVIFASEIPAAQRQQVEGYLARKWGLSASLPATHPFRAVPPIMRAFQPTDVLAPTFWLDAADATTLTLSGSAITQWRDKSSNQYAGTSSGSPVQTTLNGRPAVAFNGSQVFDFGDVADLGSANLNMFVVCQFTTTGTGSVIAKSLYGDAQLRYSLLRESGSLLVLLQGDGGGAAPGVADTSTAPRLISWTWDRATQTLYLNGTSVLSASFANTATFNSTYKLLIGGYNDGTGGTPPMSFLAFNGTIGEVLFLFGTLTSVQRQQVEGYLAQKWGLGSSLPTSHPYRSVLPSTPLFAPVSVPGLALWLDAADTTTLTLSGSSVTAWADKSGNGRNAVGTTSNPTYNATGFNSRPTVTFSNNILTSSGWSLAPNRQFAWFIVVHVTSTANVWHRILVSATGGYPNGYLGTHSSTYNFLGIAGSTTVTAPIATGTTNPQLVTYLFGTSELSANTTAVSVNGGTFSTLAGNTGGIGTNGLSIGSEAGGSASEGFLGHLSEVICYNSTVTQPQRQQIEGYLAAKWGLQARLPATHPFAKVRP